MLSHACVTAVFGGRRRRRRCRQGNRMRDRMHAVVPRISWSFQCFHRLNRHWPREIKCRASLSYDGKRSLKCIQEPYRLTSKFHTEIKLTKPHFSVKFGCKSIGFPYTFFGIYQHHRWLIWSWFPMVRTPSTCGSFKRPVIGSCDVGDTLWRKLSEGVKSTKCVKGYKIRPE